jgi:hypothetical protein
MDAPTVRQAQDGGNCVGILTLSLTKGEDAADAAPRQCGRPERLDCFASGSQ